MRTKLTAVEIKWIMDALNHDIANVKEAMDASEDNSPLCAFGELYIEGREKLVAKLMDFMGSTARVIYVMK